MVTKDGFVILIPVLIVAVVFLTIALFRGGYWWIPSLITLGLLLFSVWFFRDPERIIPSDELIIVSPADGTILEVVPVDYDEFINGKAQRVSIFLSVFNVHVNRNMVSGVVKKIERMGSKYYIAYDDKAMTENNRLRIDIESPSGNVRCTQVTGAIARRIVCHLNEGDTIRRGERYGMIRFGSRMDILLPMNCDVVVSKGMTVAGGSSVLAKWKPN